MEIVPTLDRLEVKNRMKGELIAMRPQDLVFLTNENIKLLLYYINGYIKCLNEFSEIPLNESEVEDLINNELMEEFNELIEGQSR